MSTRHGLRDNRRMKILVVEDEPPLAEYLRKALTEKLRRRCRTRNGVDGRYTGDRRHYDLVLLDVMLHWPGWFRRPARIAARQAHTGADAHRARQGGGPREGAAGRCRRLSRETLSPWPNYSHASRRCYGVAPSRRRARIPPFSNWPTSNSIWSGARRRVPDSAPRSDGQGIHVADLAVAPARAGPAAHGIQPSRCGT